VSATAPFSERKDGHRACRVSTAVPVSLARRGPPRHPPTPVLSRGAPPPVLLRRSMPRALGAMVDGGLPWQLSETSPQRPVLGCGGATRAGHAFSPTPPPCKEGSSPRHNTGKEQQRAEVDAREGLVPTDLSRRPGSSGRASSNPLAAWSPQRGGAIAGGRPMGRGHATLYRGRPPPGPPFASFGASSAAVAAPRGCVPQPAAANT